MEHHSEVISIVGGVVTLLLIAAGTLAITKRLIKLPFSIVLVFIGIGIAQATERFPDAAIFIPHIDVSPELILFVFLPTLVFESAFNMDTRILRANIIPVLMLAAPGLLLSTFIIGGVVSWATTIPFSQALLLGAILSATDPVAVIALFKQLGAPARLTILVEGESLFNDATALVVSRIVLGVVMAGTITAESVTDGFVAFLFVFFGGAIVGLLLGWITGYAIGAVRGDPFIEITLTTILAYLSFFMAEHFLHVSGVMATVMAGLVMASWGRLKISPEVRSYLEHFWEYMAFIATALIFLLVGMQVNLSAVADSFYELSWVIVAMLLSRAVAVFGVTPLSTRINNAEPISFPYQMIMYWGGLRGAIALAIVMSLPAFERSEMFVALVIGAVLFTLFVQGLTMNRLVAAFGLDKPTLIDRFAAVEGELAATQRAGERAPELLAGGQFSHKLAERLSHRIHNDVAAIKERLTRLRADEIDAASETRLLFIFLITEEKAFYLDMFNKGHLTEKAFRQLFHERDLQIDSLRYGVNLGAIDVLTPQRSGWKKRWLAKLNVLPGISLATERLRINRIAHDYEMSWGRYQACGRVLAELEELPNDAFSPLTCQSAKERYHRWLETARDQLDEDAEHYPEFVTAMQERLGRRLVQLAKMEVVEERKQRGALPVAVAEKMIGRMSDELYTLRGLEVGRLQTSPTELLRKVPFFHSLYEDEFSHIATAMRSRSFTKGEEIIVEGERGESLFLVARGVVRVMRGVDAQAKDIATLVAGDFFGEMALLHQEPRMATVRAVTHCALYELDRATLLAAMEKYPAVRVAMEEADRLRRAALDQLD